MISTFEAWLMRKLGICIHDWEPRYMALTEKLTCRGIRCKKCGQKREFK